MRDAVQAARLMRGLVALAEPVRACEELEGLAGVVAGLGEGTGGEGVTAAAVAEPGRFISLQLIGVGGAGELAEGGDGCDGKGVGEGVGSENASCWNSFSASCKVGMQCLAMDGFLPTVTVNTDRLGFVGCDSF